MDAFPLKYNEIDTSRYMLFDGLTHPVDAVLENILKSVDVQGADVLDYGCGLGREVPRLFALGAKTVVGCDPSSEMIEGAKKLFAEGGRGDVSAVSFDVLKKFPLPYEDNSFDGILSRFVFHYVVDTSAMLVELHRIVKPNGWLVAVFSDVHFEAGYEHLINTELLLKFSGGASARTLAKSGSEIVEHAKEAGFVIERFNDIPNATAASIPDSYPHKSKVRLETGLLVARKEV